MWPCPNVKLNRSEVVSSLFALSLASRPADARTVLLCAFFDVQRYKPWTGRPGRRLHTPGPLAEAILVHCESYAHPLQRRQGAHTMTQRTLLASERASVDNVLFQNHTLTCPRFSRLPTAFSLFSWRHARHHTHAQFDMMGSHVSLDPPRAPLAPRGPRPCAAASDTADIWSVIH